MTRFQRRLAVTSCLTALCALISLIPFGNRGKALHSYETALLNPSYKDSVGQIDIIHQGTTVSLKKDAGNIWTLSDSENLVLADPVLVENLISSACRIEKVYEIARSQKHWESAGLTEDNQWIVSFLDRYSPRVYTKVYFGQATDLTNRRYFRTDRSQSVYEIQDSFASFLNNTLAFWAQGELLSLAEQPVSYVMKEGNKFKKITDGRPDFPQISHNLKAIRHGLLAQTPGYESKASLTCEDESGRFVILTFYEDIRPQNAGAYLVNTTILPSYKDNSETQEFLKSLSFTYEMSEWTFEKIRKEFFD